jgi:dipeptidyl aminopeptidase/acylaminoacyl peptidase
MKYTFLLFVALGSILWGQKQPLQPEDLLKLARIGEPRLSPDGKSVVYSVRRIDLEANKSQRDIYVQPLAGGAPKALSSDGSSDRPVWSPDGKKLAWMRGGQIWLSEADGANARALTSISTEASGALWTGDSKHILFVSSVYPDCPPTESKEFPDACNAQKMEAEAKSKVKARTYTSLLYRHWTDYQGLRRSHLLAVAVDNGRVRDLTPGRNDVPPFSLGGPDDYASSPDGKEVCYVMNADPQLATSTNSDLFVVPLDGGEAKKITVNMGADNSPQYSPDGRWLAYRTQTRPGYESDKWRLVVMERATGRATILTEGIDRPVQSFAWTPDSGRILFSVEDRGRTQVQMISVNGGGTRTIISGSSSIDDLQFAPDGRTLLYTEMTGSRPTEIYRVSSAGGAPVALTGMNSDVLARMDIRPLEEITVESPQDRAKVHSFVVKPPGFDAKKTYPVLFLIHGGPQGAWGESWSYRWNPQVFASAGYVVVMPNPRGSTGYGQKFTDDINGDWGGRVYEDIMATVDWAAAQSWADSTRFAAAGASYGGYMVNWMLGHSTRFAAFVSHAGVFDLRSMAGETEETWFPLWEFRGMPWEQPEQYQKWSPSWYVNEFRTPTLVIHGELDYRVPVGQGMQLFTALQMKKVPSKLLLFPDEGHWILKPQNSMLWHHNVLDWLGEFTRKR